MTTLAIPLDDNLAARLRARAERMGVPLEVWARDVLATEPVADSELGEDFERITNRIMEKNAELYRRLA